MYAKYGRPEDFRKLEDLKIDVKGKIVLVRYGDNFRGVKSFVAEEHGAAGVIIYSDPIDDGCFKGDAYPRAVRPETACSADRFGTCFSSGRSNHAGVCFDHRFAGVEARAAGEGDGRAEDSDDAAIVWDAQPILQNLAGPETPRDWQGALPFTYHVGPGPVKVK